MVPRQRLEHHSPVLKDDVITSTPGTGKPTVKVNEIAQLILIMSLRSGGRSLDTESLIALRINLLCCLFHGLSVLTEQPLWSRWCNENKLCYFVRRHCKFPCGVAVITSALIAGNQQGSSSCWWAICSHSTLYLAFPHLLALLINSYNRSLQWSYVKIWLIHLVWIFLGLGFMQWAIFYQIMLLSTLNPTTRHLGIWNSGENYWSPVIIFANLG